MTLTVLWKEIFPGTPPNPNPNWKEIFPGTPAWHHMRGILLEERERSLTLTLTLTLMGGILLEERERYPEVAL